jgi:hypothetical protein
VEIQDNVLPLGQNGEFIGHVTEMAAIENFKHILSSFIVQVGILLKLSLDYLIVLIECKFVHLKMYLLLLIVLGLLYVIEVL